MKAILVNGEIKTFSRVPKSWSDENGLHLNIKDGSKYGFKDVVYPEFDGRIEELDNLHLDGDVYIYDVIERPIKETLVELKANKVSELKSTVGFKLSKTDWYIIRESDSGEATPQSIKDERAALRTQSDELEAEINALTTKKAVLTYDLPTFNL
jgi:predicted N-acyltransferase